MAVSLILKNSSVEDRHPTANQLTNGEISLNYNEAGAFLSCRDTNGDIQHIGGVKIDDATPGSPSKQALWFQPSTSKLFIYDGTGWLVVASGGGSGPGSDTVDQILAGNGINSDPSTGLGVITLDADLNFSRGLEFVAGQIAIAIGVGLEFDVDGRLANAVGAVQYRGTLDLTSSDPTPTNPAQGDTWVNTADGTSNAVWNPDIPTGTAVEVGDLVIYNGTIWTFVARGLSPAERTDLGLGVVDDVSVEVTSSTGSNVQLPAATGTTAGVLTAADKVIIDEGASTWERNGSILQPVDDTYDVEIGGGDITLASGGTASFAGNVGIGTASPSRRLTVNNNTASIVAAQYNRDNSNGGSTANSIYQYSADGVGRLVYSVDNVGTENYIQSSQDFRLESGAGSSLKFSTNGSNTRATIDSTGDLLFGGTLPSAPNITLASDGAITAGTYNTLTVGFGGGDLDTNTAVGSSALDFNTTGIYNTAIGRQALLNNTIGISNTATGHLALLDNTEGSSNTAMGRQSLFENTTGGSNSGFGYRSLQKNIDGNHNTGLGLQSLQFNTSGLSNTAVGSSALQNNTTSSLNSAVGRQALFNTNAANNSGVGYRALYNNSTGVRNTAVGCQAGFYIEGDDNTILGAYEGTAADSTLSNTVIISAGLTERMRIDSTGNVGIGTTDPQSKLSVDGGDVTIIAPYIATGVNSTNLNFSNRQNGNWRTCGISSEASSDIVFKTGGVGTDFTDAGTEKVRILGGSGNVGIGTTNPDAKLVINEPANSTTPAKIKFVNEGDRAVTVGFEDHNAAPSFAVSSGDGSTAFVGISSTGNVGIGTTNPLRPLDVTASGNRAAIFRALTATANVELEDPTTTNTLALGRTGNDLFLYSDDAKRLTVLSGGNVGIGTTSPQSELTVRGGTPQITLEPTADTQNCRLQFCTTDGTIQSTIQAGGSDGTDIKLVNSVSTTETVRFTGSGDVLIGGTLPSAPNITLNTNGSATFSGKLVSASTVFGDGGTTLTTKDYVDSAAYAGIPQNAQTSAYTLVSTDNGQHISITTGGVTVPSAVFSVGDTISIYNNSAADQTITQGASVTLRFAGTVNTGNRTLAQRGLATVLCVGNNEFVISGGGLS